MEILNSTQEISIDDIFNYTNGGYNIYSFYGYSPKKLMRRPWKTDKHLSFSIFKKDIWLWKDQANEDSGNAIHFVMNLFNLSFYEAITKIKGDFGLSSTIIAKAPVYVAKPEVIHPLIPVITPYTQKHLDYWQGIPMDFLLQNNYYAINELSMGSKQYIRDKTEIAFFYKKDNKEGKAYFPKRSKGFRFIGNIRGNYWFHLDEIKDIVDKIFVVKSNKDAIFFKYVGLNAVVARNESVQSFTPEIREKLESKVNNKKDIIICYGTDPDGFTKSKEITDTFGYGWFNIPKPYLSNGIDDFYSFICVYGIENFKLLLKKKKLLNKYEKNIS
jgi:hypothetical protein